MASRVRVPATVVVVLLTVFMAALGGRNLGVASAQTGTQPPPLPGLPPNQPRRGLIFDGLQPPSGIPGDLCERLYRLSLTNLCTHGPDPAPEGLDITQSVAPVEPTTAQALSGITCEGDGSSGFRTEVIYARASDRTDRYSTYLTSFRQWALDADAIYHESAAATGGYRRIRFVHDASCTLIVRRATLSSTGDDTFSNTVSELQALGYNRADRKYMIFVDANVYCGIGHIYGDDQPGEANANNTGPLYGRSDSGCWNGGTAAHEHMHNLGGVQLSAPNTSGGYHCVDEFDLMCYADSSSVTLRYPCADSSHDLLFDCNHEDYFHTSPTASSYLATYWNAANNRFLISTQPTPASMIHVGVLSGARSRINKGWQATVTITIHTGEEQPAAGATVSGSWSAGSPKTGSCTTDTNGVCQIKSGSLQNRQASVLFKVTNVTSASLSYRAADNHDETPVGEITVLKP